MSVIIVARQGSQDSSNETTEPRQMLLSARQNQAPFVLFTIGFSWDMHDSGTDDPRGIVLTRGQEIPGSIKMLPEYKAVIELLLDLNEVAFVVVPPSYSSCMLHVGRTMLANEDAIMLRVAAVLKGFNIVIVNRGA